MKKHTLLFLHLFNFNLKNELEYRKNFFIRLVTQVFFVLIQIVVVETFFRYTQAIGSWSRIEVFLLVGIFRLIEGLFHILVHSNLMYLPELVHLGELDLLLSKPVNILFYISLRKHQLYELTTLLAGILIIFSTQLIHGFQWFAVIGLSILGFVSLYSVMLIFASMSFYIPRLTALSDIWDVISKTTRFPLDIFTQNSKLFAGLVAPLLLVATIPSQILLNKISLSGIPIQFLGSIALFLLATSFFHFALRHYSSASS